MNNISVSEMNSLSQLLGSTGPPTSGYFTEGFDNERQEIEYKMLQLKNQNDAIYQNIQLSAPNTHEIENEMQFIRDSIQDLKKGLRDFDGGRFSSTTTNRTSSKILQETNQLKTRQNSVNYTQPKKRRAQTLQEFEYYQQRSNVVIYLPLNKLCNSSFLRQSGYNSLQFFQIFKNGQIGDPKIFNYQNPIQIDLMNMLNISLEKKSINTTYVIYLMKGCSKKQLMAELFTKLELILQKSSDIEISYAELIVSIQKCGVEHLLQRLLSKSNIETLYNLDSLRDVFSHHWKEQKQLKSVVKDQIQLQSSQHKKNWIKCKQSLRRNILFTLQYTEDHVQRKMNFAIISSGYSSLQEQFSFKSSMIINSSRWYQELLSEILSMNYRKFYIFSLNPLPKYNRQIEEFLLASKTLEVQFQKS